MDSLLLADFIVVKNLAKYILKSGQFGNLQKNIWVKDIATRSFT